MRPSDSALAPGRSSPPSEASARAAFLAGQRASWVEIDGAAIRHNLRLVRELAGTARVYAVCKGDAYGFDAPTIAACAIAEHLDALACGDPADVRRLREAGVGLPILLYAGTLAEELPALATPGVIVTAHDAATLATCLDAGLTFSVKLDTGFNRFGFREEDLDVVVAAAHLHPQARVHGVYAHLTDTDAPASVATQAGRFERMAARLHAAGWTKLERMVASSRIMIAHPELTFDAVNPGRFLFGIFEPPWDARVAARSALAAVKASIISLKRVPPGSGSGYGAGTLTRDTLLGVIPFGFTDGYPRLPAGGAALVRGRRVPLLGPRHTEHCMLDVTDVPGVALGDEVVLLGAQGDDRIDIHELVDRTGVPLIELVPRLAANPRRRFL